MAWSISGFERTRIKQATSSSESSEILKGGFLRESRKSEAYIITQLASPSNSSTI